MAENDLIIIAEGGYETVDEAKHALTDPFIESFVEKTGRFRIHNLDNIIVASGILLSDLTIEQVGDGVFAISCGDSPKSLNRHRANRLAEEIRRQGMFDEVRIEEAPVS